MLKKIQYLAMISFLLFCFAATPAVSHTLWLNAYSSTAHPPGHVMVAIGWGHSLPIDDFPNELNFAAYSLFAPNQHKTELALPQKKKGEAQAFDGLSVSEGDLGLRKLKFSDKAQSGTYQLELMTKGNYYTSYIDDKGHKKWAFTSMDKVKNAKKILDGMRYQAFAKTYFQMGEWTDPKPLNHDLEIIPRTDLSNVRVGDLVKVDVMFMGKPLTTSPEKSIEYLTAMSNSYGGPDKFMLACVVFGGKGQFRMPAAGQWVLNIYTRQDVKSDNDLKQYAGKCTTMLYSSTLSFHVAP